jgi:hypothetical protein
VTWNVDYTTQARLDLVGLDSELTEAITDAIVDWLERGPPRRGERVLAGVTFYEETIAGRVIVGYVVDPARERFALLWIRTRPGARP